MKIFDIEENIVENPDLEIGYIQEEWRPIICRWKILQKEIGYYETIKEYSNGGKEVEWVVQSPEKGEWIFYDAQNNEIDTNIEVPIDTPHDMDYETFELINRYILYTEEELEEEKKKRQEQAEKNDEIEKIKIELSKITNALDTLLGI